MTKDRAGYWIHHGGSSVRITVDSTWVTVSAWSHELAELVSKTVCPRMLGAVCWETADGTWRATIRTELDSQDRVELLRRTARERMLSR